MKITCYESTGPARLIFVGIFVPCGFHHNDSYLRQNILITIMIQQDSIFQPITKM